MGKLNLKRVLLGGFVAGIILLVFSIVLTPIAFKIDKPVLDYSGQEIPTEISMGDIIKIYFKARFVQHLLLFKIIGQQI